jgi:hypothetical protein
MLRQTYMKSTIKILILSFLTIVTSCMGPKYVSTIVSDHYDKNKDQTTYTKFPYGSLSLPGQWTKTSLNQVSGQQNFESKDSLSTALLINQASSYPFYVKGMTSNEFVKAFYEWDSKYFIDNIKANCSIIKQDTVNHFIIWQIIAHNDKYNVENQYLFGCENGLVFTIFAPTRKLTFEQKIDFMETVYKNKTVGTCCN